MEVVAFPMRLAMAVPASSTPKPTPCAREEIEARAARGDREALAELLKQTSRPVFALCRALCGPALAPDLTQESLSRIVTAIAQFDPARGTFRSFALTIARNTCRDRQRRLRLEHSAFSKSGDAPLDDAAAPTRSPEQQALHKEHLRSLDVALAQLADGPRQALVLFYIQGASYEDIATTLKVPIGTVMSWIHRGRKQLRQAFSKETTP